MPIPLTTRQVQILELRADGLTTRQVAERVGLTEGTVKVYLCQAAERTGVSTRALVAEVIHQRYETKIRAWSLALLADCKQNRRVGSTVWKIAQSMAFEIPEWRKILKPTEAVSDQKTPSA